MCFGVFYTHFIFRIYGNKNLTATQNMQMTRMRRDFVIQFYYLFFHLFLLYHFRRDIGNAYVYGLINLQFYDIVVRVYVKWFVYSKMLLFQFSFAWDADISNRFLSYSRKFFQSLKVLIGNKNIVNSGYT